jgi:signal transduction histidine kinase/DNA-binding response OmpR family regulator
MPMADLLRGQALAGEFGAVDVDAEVRRRIATLHTGRATVLTERTRPDGSTLELRRSRLPGGGFVTLYTDITARKRAEDAQAEARRLAEEATEQKSRFVAIVSHEIRTPLNAVVNSLALLDQSGLSAAQRRLAETASQAGDALLELINDILELSKMEAGQLAVRPSVFDLQALLDGVLEMFRAQAAERGIHLVVDVAPDVPARVRADGGRLRQVMMNFVSNAAKFSLPGLVTLRAAAGNVAGAPSLLLAVQDQGPRIADHEAELLFQPFSRLDNARASGTPGTGLGLAICERLTRLMGGQIGVRPTRDGGNEFWITLPLEAAAAAAAGPGGAMGQVIALKHRRRSAVLLVEDIPANHLVTATMLRREGHRVDVAESGPEALRLVAERPYDLVFMDLIMPGMNGYETTRRMRALSGPAGQVPIVALTANTAPEDRARCLAAGMNDMMGKPVRPQEMFAILGRTVWHRDRGIAPMPRADTAPVLDLLRLADLQRGLPAATLASLLEQCLADMRRRMQTLRDALTAGQTREIEEIAHAVAGMAGTYGLATVDRRMRQIMTAGRNADVTAARQAADDMEADLEAASTAVREHVRALAA